jgi:hypothetical protein
MHNVPPIDRATTSPPPLGSRQTYRSELQRLQDQLRLWRQSNPRDSTIEGVPEPIHEDTIGIAFLTVLEAAAGYGLTAEELTGRAWAAFAERRHAYERENRSTTAAPSFSDLPSPRRSATRSATSSPAGTEVTGE